MAMATSPTNSTSTPTVVQHVTKASSDLLLSKFAEHEAKAPPPPSTSRKLQLVRDPAAALRKKRSRRVASGLGARDVTAASGGWDLECAPPSARRRRRSGGLAEWKSLLPPSSSQAKSALIWSGEAAGIGLLLAAMEKTWRKTVKGASRMFIEKHCNTTHVRLISEVA